MNGIDYTDWDKAEIELLNKAREEINSIDSNLLELLNTRLARSLEIGALKASKNAQIYDLKREQDLLEKLFVLNTDRNGQLQNSNIEAIWREILSISRAIQKKFQVAYLGPEGTFSYYAGQEFLGSQTHFEPCASFQDIFESVYDDKCEVGIVPLENSLYGTVGTCFDLFAKIKVNIIAEFYSQIKLNLLSMEKSLMAIKKVYSHAQPFGQASMWLRKYLPNAELVPVESTALAASLASTEKNSAVIGHFNLSSVFNLNVLANSIENDKKNWTRFVLISKNLSNQNKIKNLLNSDDKIGQYQEKSSVLFIIKDEMGALAKILNCFANANINIVKLESRPIPDECWKYQFFADLACDINEKNHELLVKELNSLCTSFKILGSYRAGK